MQKRSDLPLRNRYKKRIVERDWHVRFVPKADISRGEFSFVSPKLFAPKRVTGASPEYETDRKDEMRSLSGAAAGGGGNGAARVSSESASVSSTAEPELLMTRPFST